MTMNESLPLKVYVFTLKVGSYPNDDSSVQLLFFFCSVYYLNTFIS